MTLFNSNHLPKSPPPNTITLRGRVSTSEFAGCASIQYIAFALESTQEQAPVLGQCPPGWF